MKTFYLLFFCGLAAFPAGAQVRGRVLDERGAALPGANVVLGRLRAVTDAAGRFDLAADSGLLRVSFVGYRDTALRVRGGELLLRLRPLAGALAEVTVSTGYQELPRERATGSFVQVDRALLERSVSTSVIDRLRDVVPGLVFNHIGTGLSIRGQSTLFSNAEPLLVVDGFPYEQPITDLNPGDVESISVLKDAAAASIWGSRAANGVIVITLKQGRFNQPLQVSGSASLQLGQRPDLFYVPRMSASDYIDIEQRLFSQNFFKATESSAQHLPLSPVVELLIAARDGKLSAAAADAQIAALRGLDARRDISRYLYRPALAQQYAASLQGGTATQRYFFSAGVDRNTDDLVGNGFDRLTLTGKDTWHFFGQRLECSLGLELSEALTTLDSPGNITWNKNELLYPYAQLADASGQALAITHDHRAAFLSAAQQAGLLDWSYRPLDEVAATDHTVRVSEQRLNTALRYRLPLGLVLEARYQYDRAATTGRDLAGADSYTARDLVDRYTQVAGGVLTRPIPAGGVLDLDNSASLAQAGRLQLNAEHVWGRHELTAIAGLELRTLHLLGDTYRLYGYDAVHATAPQVDGVTLFSNYDNPALGTAIPLNIAEADATDHYRSYYANAAYTWDRRLTLSASARLDQSNLFGVRTNQKGVPLWSAGAAWTVPLERYRLKLRATYGFNGNINKSLSAYTTATYLAGTGSVALLPYAQIVNPPNPELRWERVRQVNLAADLGTADGRLSGTFEFFWKQGLDLIGQTAYPPSSGIQTFTGNTANTAGRGFDMNLQSHNLKGKLGWVTEVFLSRAVDRVTAYGQAATATSYLSAGAGGGYANLGKPLFAVYSYRWAGLDPATGDPQGYLNGAVSKNYAAILAAAAPADLVYNGPSRPSVTGALRNTFTCRGWGLSANISWELGYYFRRKGVGYGNDQGLSSQSGDYARRWQKPGDEAFTQVPSVPALANSARDQFYTYSAALVEPGDNLRLADLRLSRKFRQMELYAYAANLGILWRANRVHMDPDRADTFPVPLTLAGGIRFTY